MSIETSSQPLLWEYPPERIITKGRLFFVGSAREHIGRRGTTIQQLAKLADFNDLSAFIDAEGSDYLIRRDK